MDKAKRSLEILEILQKQGSASVNDLARQFQTSEMTIRRDLAFLSKQYNITRTHGGAMLAHKEQPVVKVISFDEERVPNKNAKAAIAKQAATLVAPRQRIFLDAGSTTRGVVDYFAPDAQNVIVTNNIKAAVAALEFEKLSVIILGGEMLRISYCSAGTIAEEQVRKYQFDIAFIGAAAVGKDGNLYDGYSPEARLKESVIASSSKVYLLVDSSKFNIYDLNYFASLGQITGVITDSGLDEKARALLDKYNTPTIIAN